MLPHADGHIVHALSFVQLDGQRCSARPGASVGAVDVTAARCVERKRTPQETTEDELAIGIGDGTRKGGARRCGTLERHDGAWDWASGSAVDHAPEDEPARHRSR